MKLSTSEIISIAQLVSSEIDRTNNQKAKEKLAALLGKIEDVIKRKSAGKVISQIIRIIVETTRGGKTSDERSSRINCQFDDSLWCNHRVNIQQVWRFISIPVHGGKNRHRDKLLRMSTVLALCHLNKIVFVPTPSATVAGHYRLSSRLSRI